MVETRFLWQVLSCASESGAHTVPDAVRFPAPNPALNSVRRPGSILPPATSLRVCSSVTVAPAVSQPVAPGRFLRVYVLVPAEVLSHNLRLARSAFVFQPNLVACLFEVNYCSKLPYTCLVFGIITRVVRSHWNKEKALLDPLKAKPVLVSHR